MINDYNALGKQHIIKNQNEKGTKAKPNCYEITYCA